MKIALGNRKPSESSLTFKEQRFVQAAAPIKWKALLSPISESPVIVLGLLPGPWLVRFTLTTHISLISSRWRQLPSVKRLFKFSCTAWPTHKADKTNALHESLWRAAQSYEDSGYQTCIH